MGLGHLHCSYAEYYVHNTIIIMGIIGTIGIIIIGTIGDDASFPGGQPLARARCPTSYRRT